MDKLLGRKSWSWHSHSSKKGWRYRERKQFLAEMNQELDEDQKQREYDEADRQYQIWLDNHWAWKLIK